MVLLSIRTSVKENLGRRSAELFYGTSLRLPGEFLVFGPITQPCSIQYYATNLPDTMEKLQPVPPRTSPTKTFVSQDLDDCSHIFVRVDGVKRPLQQPYDEPYRVVKRTRKNLIIDRCGTTEVISMDRAKPAYHLSDNTQDPGSLPAPPDTQATDHKHSTKKQITFLLYCH
ncbi:uncharacterized protein LOC143021972 [Oratosquilla oratoria]|uniref:uncharacterized protein LOC143021972 n=1 Tax=Oratosquilla oratoria TaxID=337810 RepID=UPI003F75E921